MKYSDTPKVNLKDAVKGRLYRHKTLFNWLIIFHRVSTTTKNKIYGDYCLCMGDNFERNTEKTVQKGYKNESPHLYEATEKDKEIFKRQFKLAFGKDFNFESVINNDEILSMETYKRNQLLVAIKDSKSNGRAPMIKEGKIVSYFSGRDDYIFFDDTPDGQGSYLKSDFRALTKEEEKAIKEKKEELIEMACLLYKDRERVAPIPAKFRDDTFDRGISDSHYCFSNDPYCFYYDPVDDTLCNWGRGLGLIYRQGVWAENRDALLKPQIKQDYELY